MVVVEIDIFMISELDKIVKEVKLLKIDKVEEGMIEGITGIGMEKGIEGEKIDVGMGMDIKMD